MIRATLISIFYTCAFISYSQPPNDNKMNAIDVTGLINGCSTDKQYTTTAGSGDESAGACWITGPNKNVWFSFVASASSISVLVDRGGSKGTQRRTQIALWDDGLNEIACKKYHNDGEDVVLDVLGLLTIGETYFISVDSYGAGYYGTFTLCLSEQVTYDYLEGAVEIVDINNWCSDDAAYSTIGATADLISGGCWNNSGPKFNRWFYFEAITDGISVTVDRGGTKGIQRRTQVSIWEADGTSEIACKRYEFDSEDVIVETLETLVPGNLYYISVDSHEGGYQGTFTLCVDDNPSYDYYAGAIELTDLNGWCSENAEYTTTGGTADKNAGSCWDNSGPRFNKWFKFRALSETVDVQVDIGGSKGTQLRTQIALWESDGLTEVECNRYSVNGDNVGILFTGLTAGEDYFISVDSYNSNYDGSFTLCINNVEETFYSTGNGSWNDPAIWSLIGHGGASGTSIPGLGDIVNIEGHSVIVSTNEEAAQVNLTVGTANTALMVDGANLKINGKLTMINTGNNLDGRISVMNNGTLDILDDLSMNRSGGSNLFNLTASESSSIVVNKDLLITSDGGNTINNTISLNDGASLYVKSQATMTTISGIKSQITLNQSSSFSVDENINFVADNTDLVEIEVNDNAILNIGSTIIRGATPYGILDCNNNATVTFTSNKNLQIWPGQSGVLTDGFEYVNVEINNGRITSPQIILAGDVSMSGVLTLTNGIVKSSSSAALTLLEGATVSGGSQESFIDGPFSKKGNAAFEFPTGDGAIWAPIEVSGLVGADAATTITAEYVADKHSNRTLASPDPSGEDLSHVSAIEYWDLDVSGSLSSAHVTLHWKDAVRSGIEDYSNLRIAHFDSGSGEWKNYQVDVVNASDPGFITVNNVTEFSPFTFGTITLTNPLPVELAFFYATSTATHTSLHWATYSEQNNDYFLLEKSLDGSSFSDFAVVPGIGNSNQLETYGITTHKEESNTYFKLYQVDFDGLVEELGTIRIDGSTFNIQSPLIYPNPIEGDFVEIQLRTTGDHIWVGVSSLAGRLLKELELESGTSYAKVEAPKEPGMYLLTLIVDDETVVIPFLRK